MKLAELQNPPVRVDFCIFAYNIFVKSKDKKNMFNPKTEKIKNISRVLPYRIKELESILNGKTNVYIDYANVRPWANKLDWHIDLKRLKQFLNSFDNIWSIKLYNGTLIKDAESKSFIKELKSIGYEVKTKPVKIRRLSIDVSSIPPESPEIIKNFIRKSLLQKFKIETIEFLNSQLKELNNQGIFWIEDLKCNFDVEIGRDMLVDYDKNGIDTFVLWSGDSDFA
ncbi:MAG TPA: NYN domain-containing protein, partial [Candidatus Colwellbacteria bacterium]|nr:NYN domain-containing protein [Candidatus Colwellbacteria bacterium]